MLVEAIAASFGSAAHRAKLMADLESAFTTTLAALASTVEAKDDYTACHGEDVAELVERVALRMSLSHAEARDARYAALLHDIGKIGVPSEILLKPGPLTRRSGWSCAATPPSAASSWRASTPSPTSPPRSREPRAMGRRGLPDGLAAEKIPLAARIIAACDTYDAIVTDRPYRRARSPREARRSCAGSPGPSSTPASSTRSSRSSRTRRAGLGRSRSPRGVGRPGQGTFG